MEAGLFSAILTAFVVETYPMLQVDNSDTTNQLLAIGLQNQFRLASFMVPDHINSTLSTLSNTPSFSPPTAARIINILFFLSLGLSLASALFGIMAKQWLREYMRWNSPLAAPRENVLVRQLRIEAWESWRVGATISSIPVLLELAMVLFLVGITILLWTLDDIVAVFITVFVATFLGVLSAFTMLPIFMRSCPYKSPTAWAFVAFFNTLMILPRRLAAFGHIVDTDSKSSAQQSPTDHRPQTWRDRDLQTCRATRTRPSPWWRRGSGTQSVTSHDIGAGAEFLNEMTYLGADGQFRARSRLFKETSKANLFNRLLNDLQETPLLLRALSWMQQASQDALVHVNVDRCLETIHLTLGPSRSTSEEIVRTTTDLSLVSSLQHRNGARPEQALIPTASGEDSELVVFCRRLLCDAYEVKHEPPSDFWIDFFERVAEGVSIPQSLNILPNLLLRDIKKELGAPVRRQYNERKVRRLMGLFMALTYISVSEASPLPDIHLASVGTLLSSRDLAKAAPRMYFGLFIRAMYSVSWFYRARVEVYTEHIGMFYH